MLGLGTFVFLVFIAALIWGSVNRAPPDPASQRQMLVWAKLLPDAPVKRLTRGTYLVLTTTLDNTWMVDSEIGKIALIQGDDAHRISFRAREVGKPSAYPEGDVNRDTILLIVEFGAHAA